VLREERVKDRLEGRLVEADGLVRHWRTRLRRRH
jgi:hypothetical protein